MRVPTASRPNRMRHRLAGVGALSVVLVAVVCGNPAMAAEPTSGPVSEVMELLPYDTDEGYGRTATHYVKWDTWLNHSRIEPGQQLKWRVDVTEDIVYHWLPDPQCKATGAQGPYAFNSWGFAQGDYAGYLREGAALPPPPMVNLGVADPVGGGTTAKRCTSEHNTNFSSGTLTETTTSSLKKGCYQPSLGSVAYFIGVRTFLGKIATVGVGVDPGTCTVDPQCEDVTTGLRLLGNSFDWGGVQVVAPICKEPGSVGLTRVSSSTNTGAEVEEFALAEGINLLFLSVSRDLISFDLQRKWTTTPGIGTASVLYQECYTASGPSLQQLLPPGSWPPGLTLDPLGVFAKDIVTPGQAAGGTVQAGSSYLELAKDSWTAKWFNRLAGPAVSRLENQLGVDVTLPAPEVSACAPVLEGTFSISYTAGAQYVAAKYDVLLNMTLWFRPEYERWNWVVGQQQGYGGHTGQGQIAKLICTEPTIGSSLPMVQWRCAGGPTAG